MSAKSEAANKILKPIFGNFIKTIVKETAQPSFKSITKIKLAPNKLRKIFTGEAAAEKRLNKLAKQRILQQKSSWRPTQKMRDANLEGKKQAIRNAKAMRSAASKAELEWMKNNADKATKVYKSGTMEFGGDANKLALLKVRQEAMKPFISQEASKIRKNRGLGTAAAVALLSIPAYNVASNKIYDNVFPFGYYDSRDDDPTDPKSIKAIGKSLYKFILGAYGFKSDARKIFDQIASMDLNDPKQRERAIQLYNSNPVVRSALGTKADIGYIQKIFRARIDLNNLHAGREQEYASFVPNEEYQSIASRENPELITWVPSDKQLREEYRQQGRAYNLLQGKLPEGTKYKSYGVSDNNGMYGGMSIVKNHNNGAGKYKDEWDFIGDEVLQPLGLSKRVIVADTIPASSHSRMYHNFGQEASVRK